MLDIFLVRKYKKEFHIISCCEGSISYRETIKAQLQVAHNIYVMSETQQQPCIGRNATTSSKFWLLPISNKCELIYLCSFFAVMTECSHSHIISVGRHQMNAWVETHFSEFL